MKAPVYSKEGKKKGEVDLNPEIYGARVNHRLLELVRTGYAASLRRGTADTKTRKEIQGGGKKPWKQKGTGRARHGSIRSPIWRGGGTVFGPTPRSYYVALPNTMRKSALVSALSLRAGQQNVFVLEALKLETPKTKELAEFVKQLPLNDKRALCIVREIDENLERASRNLTGLVEMEKASNLNAYHVMQREKVLIEEGALEVLEGRLLGNGAPASDGTAADAEAKPKKSPAARKAAAKPAKKEADSKGKKKKS